VSDIDPKIVELIGVLTAVFPNHLNGEGVKTYARLLSDIPLPLLTIAIEQCANDCTFFPKPVEIRDRVMKISQIAPANAGEAWEEVMIAMKRDGFHKHPKFDDPIIQRAVEAMDWQALCSSENTIADRAHFMKIYDQLIERSKQDAKLLPSAIAMRKELTSGTKRLNEAPQ